MLTQSSNSLLIPILIKFGTLESNEVTDLHNSKLKVCLINLWNSKQISLIFISISSFKYSIMTESGVILLYIVDMVDKLS